MSIRFAAPVLAAAVAGLAFAGSAHAQANVMKDCGAEYQAAKTANTLNGQKWNDYLKDCRVRHAAQPAAAAPAATPAPAPAAANPLKPAPAATAVAPKPAAAAPAAAAPAAAGSAVFPKAIDPKYSTLPAAKQRMSTCLDQYKANKATNGNGGLNWIMKGGGYYSQCNARLKG